MLSPLQERVVRTAHTMEKLSRASMYISTGEVCAAKLHHLSACTQKQPGGHRHIYTLTTRCCNKESSVYQQSEQ